MAEINTVYTSPFEREAADIKEDKGFTLILTPWSVQNICLELIRNQFLNNDPLKLGYKFTQKYDTDPVKSGVFIDIAYKWDAKVVGQRPAVFISRSEARTASPILNQTVGMNVKESEKTKLNLVYMSLGITCIAPNVGFAEDLADFVKIPLTYFQEQIREDFRFRRFRLVNVSPPSLYPEAKDHIMVLITVETVFDERWVVKGDDLKIKTLSKTIFDACTGQPRTNQ